MKGDAKVIEYLNAALRSELTAISQYWCHFRMQEDWGLAKMAKKSRAESIEEMGHADKLIARILFLEGHPNLQKLDPLRIGEGPRETLECDLATELEALPLLREAVAHADAVGDYVSRQLLVKILDSEEEHVDWLETQLDLIGRIGEPNYLLSKLED